jgi:hypothetical protein
VKCDSTISSGSSSSDPMRTTKSGENDITIGGEVSMRSLFGSTTPLSECDENLKSEAVTMIQDVITTQEECKTKISEAIKHNAQIGYARLDGSSLRGTPSYVSFPCLSILSRSLTLLLLFSQAPSCP